MEITTNQAAFLKVSEELRRVENSLQALDLIGHVLSRDGYSRSRLAEVKEGEIYTPEVQVLMPMVRLARDGNEQMSALKERLNLRKKNLAELCDAYLAGKDIVAHRLMKS